MKQQYNKLQFIKNKKINETTKQQYIWEKLYFLRNTLGKIPEIATDPNYITNNILRAITPGFAKY